MMTRMDNNEWMTRMTEKMDYDEVDVNDDGELPRRMEYDEVKDNDDGEDGI